MMAEPDEIQAGAQPLPRHEKTRALSRHLILVVLYALGGAALILTLNVYHGLPPFSKGLSEEDYYAALSITLITGAIVGASNYVITEVWFPRLRRRYPPPSEPIIQFDLRTMFIVIAVASLLFWVVWYIRHRKLDEVVVFKLDVTNVSASFSFD